MNPIKKYFSDWTTFQKTWLFAFTLINIYLFFVWKDTLIGLIASLTGMMSVVLVAKGKISNYYFGFVNIVLYSYIAYQNKYFGEVMLNMMYYFPMQFVGIYFWIKHRDKKKSKDDIKITKIGLKEKIFWLIVSVIGIIVYGLLLVKLENTLPYVDSTTTILSIVAMILMVKRVTEQWILWIIVDIVSIYMWLNIFLQDGSDVSMLVMWSAYLVNAIYGYYNWKKLEVNFHER